MDKRIFQIIFILFLTISIIPLACNKVNEGSKSKNTLCKPKIISYHFGVEDKSISEQVSILSALKMDGMMTQIENGQLNMLDEYYLTSPIANRTFKLNYVFTSINMDDPILYSTQIRTIEAIYKRIETQETELQILFYGKQDNEHIKSTLLQISSIAEKYHKNLIIYPHKGLAIETAEQALFHIKCSKKNNVFLAVHLCHELSAGNGLRIDDVIKNVAPYIKAVSISGADLNQQHDSSLPLWYWGIKPLSMSAYNLSPFINSLNYYGYSGPITIHTWGIKYNFGLEPQDYLAETRNIIQKLTTEACY